MNPFSYTFLGIVLKVIVVFVALLLGVAYLTWLERKVLGHMQHRYGPMRVGPHGLLQPIADGIKLLFKEDIIVSGANKVIYLLAPLIMAVIAFGIFAVIPFGDEITLFRRPIPLRVADVNIGILYIFALSSLGVYGIVLGGWSSNSKYPLLGALRSSAQMISYEIPMGLAIIGVLMLSGSLSMVKIVEAQSEAWFVLLQPLGFIVYMICGIAECNRVPFDLPEAENELVAGFHVEYSSMKFALFFLAEYAHIIAVSAIAVTLFLGGWHGPLFPLLPPALSRIIWFSIKVFLIVFFFIWLRATYPRFRYDQLMGFGWKVLFPLALLNILVTSFIVAIT